jgi:hypothetical protein
MVEIVVGNQRQRGGAVGVRMDARLGLDRDPGIVAVPFSIASGCRRRR